MTTAEDEIANLRTALKDILSFIKHERKNGDPTDANSSGNIMEAIGIMAKAGLKTPRASKFITVTIGEGLPPIPQP